MLELGTALAGIRLVRRMIAVGPIRLTSPVGPAPQIGHATPNVRLDETLADTVDVYAARFATEVADPIDESDANTDRRSRITAS